MKCALCNGKGKYANGLGVVSVCYYCLGTGEVNDKRERVMTEQEYIQTCNTEQLAEVLADVSLWIHPFMKQKNRFELLKKHFYEWLKQPHKPNS